MHSRFKPLQQSSCLSYSHLQYPSEIISNFQKFKNHFSRCVYASKPWNSSTTRQHPESVFGPSLWTAWFNCIPFMFCFFVCFFNKLPFWQNRENLQRDVKYLLSSSPSSVTRWCGALQKAPELCCCSAPFASNIFLVSADRIPGIWIWSS